MQDKALGYFENIRLKAFSTNSFEGIFRNARGAAPPFIDIYEYTGQQNLPREFMFLFDIKSGIGLPLFPLMVRGLEGSRSRQDEPDLFLYDIARAGDKEIAYKAVQEGNEVLTSEDGAFPELFSAAKALLREDPTIGLINDIRLRQRSLE
jgi:hypothetical protein